MFNIHFKCKELREKAHLGGPTEEQNAIQERKHLNQLENEENRSIKYTRT